MKTCATLFTIGWGAALSFGWIALAAPADEASQLQSLNITLAALGAAVGLWAWLRLRRAD